MLDWKKVAAFLDVWQLKHDNPDGIIYSNDNEIIEVTENVLGRVGIDLKRPIKRVILTPKSDYWADPNKPETIDMTYDRIEWFAS